MLKVHSLRIFMLICGFTAIVGVVADSSAQESPLRIGGNTIAWGGSCYPGHPNIIAGSKYFLHLQNTADLLPPPLVPGWPEGYIMEAALDLPEGSDFVATPGLIERLKPERYLSDANIASEKNIRDGKHGALSRPASMNRKEFIIEIPADLAGHTLAFHAQCHKGGMNLQSNTTLPITIIDPCSREDTARILATFIYASFRVGQYSRATEIADSMIAVGLLDAAALSYASRSAKVLKQYDKALVYLDQTYNNFEILGSGDPLHPPLLNREGPRSTDIQQSYEKARQELLQRIAAQEQQQQQK